MLQNRTYLGEVCHLDTQYKETMMGQRRKSHRKGKTWFPGNHEGFITEGLFNRCQDVRKSMTPKFNQSGVITRTYALHDRVFCALCVANKPADLLDDNYGKMRPAFISRDDRGYYRCTTRLRGYKGCEGKYVPVDDLDQQVVAILSRLVLPEEVRERVERAVSRQVEFLAAMKRMTEFGDILKHVDFHWEEGFTSQEEFAEKRRKIHAQLDSLQPVNRDKLAQARLLLTHFAEFWSECASQPDPGEARKQLLKIVVARVIVYDQKVLAVVLEGDFAVIIDDNKTASPGIVDAVRSMFLNLGITL